KLRGAQARMEKLRAYADRFHDLLRNLAASEMELVHPLLCPHEDVKKIGIVLVTSDRGLAGAFNINIIAAALRLANEKRDEGKEVAFFCVGKKGRDAIRKTPYAITRDMAGAMGGFDFTLADRVGIEVISGYVAHELDEVYVVYSEFVSLLRQVPTAQRILPVEPQEQEAQAPASRTEYTFEPAGQALMDVLLPRIVKALVYRGLLSTSTSEHAARMTAMDNATRNCDDLIRSLTRLFNKTRQAVITNELIDIVGGVEALKG
ncbi:MAG: ATP synthase F1 subunit gamma, partial [Deltaproteobacteria bacterium]|nr:ATP synthase F1 subunit gamma [Deltaproteobacteria bacterium]